MDRQTSTTGGRRRVTSKTSSAEDQALNQIAIEVMFLSVIAVTSLIQLFLNYRQSIQSVNSLLSAPVCMLNVEDEINVVIRPCNLFCAST